MFKMTPNVLKNLFAPKATRRYPREVRAPFESVRGALFNDIENCSFCGVCALKCPSQCITVDKKADVPKAIKQMLAEKQPCVVDFRVEREENVWPMVPAGKSLNEMDGLDILESMA